MIENWLARTGIGVAALFTLAGCGVVDAIGDNTNGHVKTVDYDTGAAGKTDDDVRLPGWVPDQARAISEAVRTTGTERILKMRLDDTELLSSCQASSPPAKAPTLSTPWWPTTTHTKATLLCDADWYITKDGNTVYAYRPETVAQQQ
ncbi:hypothetical protein FPZ12_028810 [Amycolatopsis acidicola]|uniref:Lipoprotein n=1 Tax=Amycolatopsis acidicola TaxID=2596893 RepID=A0A5N0UU17_9PSEU|nr:hypothetical protein [Amycolatopsis acidicola]KAA9155923.1 hypothetical protein FPZ12_028810 [Amycolatopsis acidicola]